MENRKYFTVEIEENRLVECMVLARDEDEALQVARLAVECDDVDMSEYSDGAGYRICGEGAEPGTSRASEMSQLAEVVLDSTEYILD